MTDRRHPPAALVAIPNLLSAARVGLAVAFPLSQGAWRPWIVIAGAITDVLDGQMARRLNLTSVAGGLLDAAADKLFVLSVLATLTFEGAMPWWAAVLVLARDVTVACVAAYAALRRRWSAFRKMAASMLGKLTTAVQFALFLVLLMPWPRAHGWAIGAAAALSVLAGADYLRRLVHTVRSGGSGAVPAGR